ncbi:hypothetical protein LCM20_12145 [Halobacillus litoralis]|uniref:hypothetical protein n=1 Tax=Halobacillus litoralis TaxID=45668 RepID=UPI001CD7E323|nr:hypothetical protein [Halobacillus litoralis]MCA0971348.1 hypothetical protein [Halobacillus litoralis]
MVIKEEFYYLMKVGLLEERDISDAALSDLGDSLYWVMTFVDQFNRKKEKVLINCVTGNLQLLGESIIVEPRDCSDHAYRLKEKIVRRLYKNLSPFNSKDFVLEHFGFDELEDHYREELQVEVEYETPILYIQKDIEMLPSPKAEPGLSAPEEEASLSNREEGTGTVHIERTIQTVHWKGYYESLGRYRPLLDKLQSIKEFDSALVTEKSTELLALRQKEVELNQKENVYYFDPVTGGAFLAMPDFPYEDDKKWTDVKPIGTQKRPSNEAVALFLGETSMNVQSKVGETYHIRQRIPYDLLFMTSTEQTERAKDEIHVNGEREEVFEWRGNPLFGSLAPLRRT